MPSPPRAYVVRIIREIPVTAADPFEAGERALNLAQRQKEWPGKMRVEVTPDDEIKGEAD